MSAGPFHPGVVFLLKQKKGPSRLCKATSLSKTALITNFYVSAELAKSKAVVFEREVLLNEVGEVERAARGEPAALLSFSAALSKYFDFETREFRLSEMEEASIFFCRFSYFKRRLEFIGDSNDCCTCRKPDVRLEDLYQCKCGQVYHSDCFKKDGGECIRCLPTIALSKRAKEDFDLIDLTKETKHANFPSVSSRSIPSSKNIGKVGSEIVVNDTPAKPVKSPLLDPKESLLSKLKDVKDNLGGDKMRAMCKRSLFTMLCETFFELKSQWTSQIKLDSPEMSGKFEELVKNSEESLFDRLNELSSKLELTLFKKHGSKSGKDSPYFEQVRTLAHHLRRGHNKVFAEKYLLGLDSIDVISNLEGKDLMDSDLRKKLDNINENFLDGRVAQYNNVLIKTTKGEIIVDQIEKTTSTNELETAVVSFKAAKSDASIGSSVLDNDAGKSFKERLSMKIDQMLTEETAQSLKLHIKLFE